MENSSRQNRAVGFLLDILRGVAIGMAFIIPGFSGGTVAAILGIYEKLVGAVADFFRSFKKSFFILLPIVIGMLLGIAALFFPIRWGLSHYPIPTVTLFVGLALGGIPSVTEKLKGRPRAVHFLALLLPLAIAAALPFLPVSGNSADLFSLDVWGYFILVGVGMLGSAALVVPGISGSMLLLILGYYGPILSLISDHLLRGDRVGHCIAVLACLALGLVAGFFLISLLMKRLLAKFPKGTYFAILGFIVGSVPAVYVSTVSAGDAALTALMHDPWYWVISAVLLLIGAALSLALVLFSRRKRREEDEKPS